MPSRTHTSGRTGVTAFIAARVSGLTFDDLTPQAKSVAADCILDWLGVSLAASREPLVDILAGLVAEDGGAAQASVIGRNERVSIDQAALLNGSMSHALDYDDVHMAMLGHPTVPVAPAVLALGELRGVTGPQLITAFAAGFETECRIGRMMGESHYRLGWHPTATLGAIGAAAAACNLLKLSEHVTAHAIGIAATRAAGLKSVFGTMCKPLHAGHAAQMGLQAARLAARGFISNPEILDVDQGFVATQSDISNPEAAFEEPSGGSYLPQVLFKYHATCYFTHSPIEALGALRREHALGADRVRRVVLKVDPSILKICDIARPVTGLEAKFSLRLTAALALRGENTALNALFADAMTQDPDLIALRDKIEVDSRVMASATACEVEVLTHDGRALRAAADVGVPMADLAAQRAKLQAKFRALATPIVGEDRADEIVALCARLTYLETLAPLIARVSGRG